jgi:hypothetical protein
MKIRRVTAGIAFCSLFITARATLGQTVTVPARHWTVLTQAVPTSPTVNTFVRALDSDRYQLIEKKDNKEVYRDRQTGEKWLSRSTVEKTNWHFGSWRTCSEAHQCARYSPAGPLREHIHARGVFAVYRGADQSIDSEFVLTSPPHGLHDLGINRHRRYD